MRFSTGRRSSTAHLKDGLIIAFVPFALLAPIGLTIQGGWNWLWGPLLFAYMLWRATKAWRDLAEDRRYDRENP